MLYRIHHSVDLAAAHLRLVNVLQPDLVLLALALHLFQVEDLLFDGLERLYVFEQDDVALFVVFEPTREADKRTARIEHSFELV